MTINELSFMPGDPKPQRSDKHTIVWLMCLATPLFMAGLFYFHFGVLPDLIMKQESVPLLKTEAEWEREICANLDAYRNGADFEDYCASL